MSIGATRAMKTIAAREAKNHFGNLIDDARSEPILVERNGRRAVVVLAPERYDELIAAQDALKDAQAIETVANGSEMLEFGMFRGQLGDLTDDDFKMAEFKGENAS